MGLVILDKTRAYNYAYLSKANYYACTIKLACFGVIMKCASDSPSLLRSVRLVVPAKEMNVPGQHLMAGSP